MLETYRTRHDPSHHFFSKYKALGPVVGDVVACCCCECNHASIRAQEAILQMETVANNSPQPETECDENFAHPLVITVVLLLPFVQSLTFSWT